MANTQNNSNGRPTKLQQAVIEKKLRPLFQRGYSSRAAAAKTGFDQKTVLRYFKQFTNQLLQNDDFIRTSVIQKQLTIQTQTSDIEAILDVEEEVDGLLKFFKKINDYENIEKFLKIKLKFIKTKQDIISLKTNLVNTPTIDTRIKLNLKDDQNVISD